MGVVDKNENLIGTVQLNQIQQTNLPPDTIIANLISEKNIYVYNNSQLSFAVDVMDRFNVDYLPVVDRNNKKKVVGVLTYKDIFAVYRKRRHEESIHKQNISLKRQGYKLIVRGKQLVRY